MTHFGHGGIIVVAAVLCSMPTAVVAQQISKASLTTHAPPTPSGPTPRAPDGHPDLSGVWDGLRDNSLGPRNANNAIVVQSETSNFSASTLSAEYQPRAKNAETERAATLLRRMGSSRPVYKPEIPGTAKELDANANEEAPLQ